MLTKAAAPHCQLHADARSDQTCCEHSLPIVFRKYAWGTASGLLNIKALFVCNGSEQ